DGKQRATRLEARELEFFVAEEQRKTDDVAEERDRALKVDHAERDVADHRIFHALPPSLVIPTVRRRNSRTKQAGRQAAVMYSRSDAASCTVSAIRVFTTSPIETMPMMWSSSITGRWRKRPTVII